MESLEKDVFNMTLDEYIQRKNIEGSLCFLDIRKKEKHIDKDKINKELNQIARKNATEKRRKTGISKFDRYRDSTGDSDEYDDEDDEEDSSIVVPSGNSDGETDGVNMENSSIRFAKEIQQMDHPECCQIKHTFKTIEAEMGIRVRSQNWRMKSENLERIPGVPRLVALPLDEDERYKKVSNGRVKKNYKNRNLRNVKAGLFIEKGNFTYKFADDNSGEDEEDTIVGIVRNKPAVKIIRENRSITNQNDKNERPININMNWNGFFRGATECIEKIHQSTAHKTNEDKIPDEQLRIVAGELFNYLKQKREKEQYIIDAGEMDYPMKDCEVSASAGPGIETRFHPNFTNLPMNLRFT